MPLDVISGWAHRQSTRLVEQDAIGEIVERFDGEPWSRDANMPVNSTLRSISPFRHSNEFIPPHHAALGRWLFQGLQVRVSLIKSSTERREMSGYLEPLIRQVGAFPPCHELSSPGQDRPLPDSRIRGLGAVARVFPS
ncbi:MULTISPECIES: hypothetical protein [Hyphomicrobiales]|jgi:hypothetical protein|uniref:hypothetical protein n=1 Tax=Methylobacterium sp. CCH7-A2 TaxID=1768789 RepID=UPI00082984B7|nr:MULTISPECIES: hypothetical protein [Hyphomicrobiales]